jgi:hypothetical protein
MSEKWEPWSTYDIKGKVTNEEKRRLEAEVLPILEPPCKQCIHFNPQREFIPHKEKGFYLFSGIRVCTAPERWSDFSCYISH